MKFFGLTLLIVIVGGVLRFLASAGDFWFDEIWTWNLVKPIENPIALITEVHHDNNHILNSLWVWSLGQKASFTLYRLPCVILGTLSIAVAGLAWQSGEKQTRLITTLLFGFSFFLIQYSSEARGYGYLMFFVTAAAALIMRNKHESFFTKEVIAFWFCCLFGLLAHATFVFAWTTLVAVSIAKVWGQSTSLFRKAGVVLSWQLVPAIFFLFVWVASYRHLEIGGGDSDETLKIVTSTLSLLIGGNFDGSLMYVFAVTTGLLLLGALIHATVARLPIAVMGWVGVVFVPLGALLILKPDPLYPRYFLVPFVFSLILLANFLSVIWIRGKPAKAVVSAFLSLFVLANMSQSIPLMTIGRGDYGAALMEMNNMGAEDRLLVASDHDFRNLMILDFYHRRIGSLKTADYVPDGKWSAVGPEWVILHDWRHDFSPPSSFPDSAGNVYVKIDEYRYAGLSGFHWGDLSQSKSSVVRLVLTWQRNSITP